MDTVREGDVIEWRGDPCRVMERDVVEFGLIHLVIKSPDGIATITDDPDRTFPMVRFGNR
jgi:hypothetical protein